jgi:hypothetical protein
VTQNSRNKKKREKKRDEKVKKKMDKNASLFKADAETDKTARKKEQSSEVRQGKD